MDNPDTGNIGHKTENDIGSLGFFPLSTTRLLPELTMSNIVIRNARHSGTSEFTPVFYADHVAHLLSQIQATLVTKQKTNTNKGVIKNGQSRHRQHWSQSRKRTQTKV
jgi:hypothetical protein